MRRGVIIAMVIVGLITMLTGIWELFPPFNEVFYPAHTANAYAFAVLVLIHVGLDWKQLLQRFKRLG